MSVSEDFVLSGSLTLAESRPERMCVDAVVRLEASDLRSLCRPVDAVVTLEASALRFLWRLRRRDFMMADKNLSPSYQSII